MEFAGKVGDEYGKIANSEPSNFEIGITMEVWPPGFFNFRLSNYAITEQLDRAVRGEHLFFAKAASPKTIVIDFSSPNVAKPMHVGHIRSTILGDCLARVLRLLGHRVVTDNHIGDWGTQFGLIILGYKRQQRLRHGVFITDDLELLYKRMVESSKNDPKILEAVRNELVKLQSGDEENLALWESLVFISKEGFDAIYHHLGVKFDFTLGESFYNPKLKPLVDELLAEKIARESDGAIAIFFDDNPQLKEHPALVRKSDGGFNYTTTDLATLAYRLETWKPDEIVYVTDGRQQLHFQQIFAAFQKWHSESKTKLAHVWFGSILGEDGKPFKTRSGETVKLVDLLEEAELRALAIVDAKNPDLPDAQKKEIARVVGLGAVKYADLLPNRQSDYIFSWDKMLALQGNTAPYLLYAYARIKSIFRKAESSSSSHSSSSSKTGSDDEEENEQEDDKKILLAAPEEIALAKHLLNFGLTLEAVADEYRPNFLCNYLFELAGKFTSFYENCPVLKAEDEATRDSRLALCNLTARVLKQGLEMLGIETVEQM